MGGVLLPYGYVVRIVGVGKGVCIEMWKRCYKYGDFADAGSMSKTTSWLTLPCLLIGMATEGRRVLGLNFMNVLKLGQRIASSSKHCIVELTHITEHAALNASEDVFSNHSLT